MADQTPSTYGGHEGSGSGLAPDQNIIDQGLGPNASVDEQIAAYNAVLSRLNGDLDTKQGRVNDTYATLRGMDPNEPGYQAAAAAYNAAISDLNRTNDSIQRVNTAIDNLRTVQVRAQGKDLTPEEVDAKKAATELTRAQVAQINQQMAVDAAKANADAAASLADNDPRKIEAQRTLTEAQTAAQNSATALNDANAAAQRLQNQITSLTGLQKEQLGIQQQQAALAQAGANTALTTYQSYNELFDYYKNQAMLPYDIAVQAANAAYLQQQVNGQALTNDEKQRILTAGGPEAGVANTQSATAVNVANAAQTALETLQKQQGDRVTALSQITDALSGNKITPAQAWNAYSDVESGSTAYQRQTEANSAANTLFANALQAGIFVPRKGTKAGGAPLEWGDFAHNLGVNTTTNIPLPSDSVPAFAQAYDPRNPPPITMPPDQLEAMLSSQAQHTASQVAPPAAAAAPAAPAAQQGAGSVNITIGSGPPAAPAPPAPALPAAPALPPVAPYQPPAAAPAPPPLVDQPPAPPATTATASQPVQHSPGLGGPMTWPANPGVSGPTGQSPNTVVPPARDDWRLGRALGGVDVVPTAIPPFARRYRVVLPVAAHPLVAHPLVAQAMGGVEVVPPYARNYRPFA